MIRLKFRRIAILIIIKRTFIAASRLWQKPHIEHSNCIQRRPKLKRKVEQQESRLFLKMEPADDSPN